MPISKQILKSILEAGASAPSGDNCQPWRITVQDDLIKLYNIPDRDVSLYNYRQRASVIALGAFIENVVLSALTHGLTTEVFPFPESLDKDLVAEIRITPGCGLVDPLAEMIHDRCTNRRRYSGGELESFQKDALIAAAVSFPETRVRLLDSEDKKCLAGIIGLNDRLVFENRELHSFLFDQIRWSLSEAEETKNGLDIRTLELAPPDALAFKFFKNYELVNILNYVGVSRFVGANATKLALSAAALGVITMPRMTQRDYLTCGRAMERIWLAATKEGLSFQLMTGITCLMGRIADGDSGTLSASHVSLLKDARSKLTALLGNESDVPLIFFRVGRSEPPQARSLRLPIEL